MTNRTMERLYELKAELSNIRTDFKDHPASKSRFGALVITKLEEAKHCEAAFPRINFNEIQAEALQSVGQNYGERFFEAIKLSIKNGWRTVCFDALPAPNAARKKLSATEQTVESARRILGAIST